MNHLEVSSLRHPKGPELFVFTNGRQSWTYSILMEVAHMLRIISLSIGLKMPHWGLAAIDNVISNR